MLSFDLCLRTLYQLFFAIQLHLVNTDNFHLTVIQDSPVGA